MQPRDDLARLLDEYYRTAGWAVEHRPDGTVRAKGIGGVTWIGLPVVAGDLADPGFAETLRKLSEVRMVTGELCPLELLPDPACAAELHSLLGRLHLADSGHVEVYAVAA